MHSFLNWLGLGFAALHGIILIGDHFIKIGLPEVFTPFLSPYRPVPVGLGIIAFYLMLLLSLSFYARNHLGQKNFRLLHYVSYAVFLMVTVHGVLAGTDSGALWWLYAVSLVVVVVMTVMRDQRQPARADAAAGAEAGVGTGGRCRSRGGRGEGVTSAGS